MALSFSQTSLPHVKAQDANQNNTLSRNGAYMSNSEASTPPVGREDGYGECDASLQNYKSDLHSLARITNSTLLHAIEVLSASPKGIRTKENQDDLVESGAYCFQVGNKTNIEVRIREESHTIQISSVVHRVKLDGMSSGEMRLIGGYSLQMKVMRLNSWLSRTSCGGRICACDGRFLFFCDFPMSILNENGMLQVKLDEFFLTSLEVRHGFD
jgi:hypothetical protein